MKYLKHLKYLYSFPVLLAIIVLCITLWINQLDEENDDFNIFSTFENVLMDLRFNLREGVVQDIDYDNNLFISQESKVITIDQEALTKIGKWPWSRNVHAEFLNKVQKFSPKLVHLDILFSLEEEVPINKNETKENIQTIKRYFKKLDDEFAEALKKNDNVYIDQYLLYDQIPVFDEEYLNRLKLNEEKLKKLAVKPDYKITSPVYRYTDPLVEKFFVNANLGIINAIPDHDEILRKATLIFPYQDADKKIYYLSSLFLELVKDYFLIENENIKVGKEFLVLENALVPKLEKETKNPLVELVDMSAIKNKIHSFRQKKYDNNLFNLFVILFNTTYKNDSFKTPDYPIKLIKIAEDKYELLNGKEIFDAALALDSKKIKIIFYEKNNITVPLVKNKDGNPYAMNINYANREEVTIITEENQENKRLYPTQSYADVYFQTFLPDLPNAAEAGEDFLIEDNLEIKKWFNDFVANKRNEIVKYVFDRENSTDINLVFDYVLNENLYDGAFFFYDLFLNQENQEKYPFDEKKYKDFLNSFFIQNRLILNHPLQNTLALSHPLLNDFLLNEKVVIDSLINEYINNYSQFYNKILLVGAFAPGMARDVHKTTYDEMFGITTILNVVNTMIKQNFLINSTKNQLYIAMFFACFFFSLSYSALKNYWKYIFFAIFSFLIFIFSVFLFEEYSFLLNTTPFLFANLTIFTVVTLYSLLYEERDKKYLKEMFSNYLAPEVIDTMYQSKQSIKLGGDEKNITAYFTDIQGFSSFSEILTAEQLVELLNEYLGAMTDILLEQGGTLDKYEGDAIIAFYGAPLEVEDAAFKACKTAILMQEKLKRLTKKWESEKTNDPNRIRKKISEKDWNRNDKWPKIVHSMKMRIGINSGNIVVGNMGSEKRKNYTMMGDDVNLAARLESAAKQYGIYSVASNNTFEQKWIKDGQEVTVKDFFNYRLIDKIVVVGKEEPVSLFEIVALKEKTTKEEEALIEVFNQGMKAYLKADFKKAITYFKESDKLERYPNQKITPSKVLINRCGEYIKNPNLINSKKWDGVYVLTSK